MPGTERDYREALARVLQCVDDFFALADNEAQVCRYEQTLNYEIAYHAAIAQAERVKPPGGWDVLGRC